MNYIEAMEYFEKVNIYGSVLGLDSIKSLLKLLGNPEKELKVIHVAGTNGKGSTMAFVSSVLVEAGLRVGHFSSPAVFERWETIRINGNNISENAIAEIMSEIKKCCDEMVEMGMSHPTPFEIETALAFKYFANENCDISIIECGMGGETDATNAFEKVLCSVITSISIDHSQFLGNTVSDIAKIKAGIIKKACPVVTSNHNEEVLKVLKCKAQSLESELVISSPAKMIGMDMGYQIVEVVTEKRKYNLKTSLLGTYQLTNLSLAISVIEELENQRIELKDYIENGIAKAKWPGRMEVIMDSPLFIIDGAHNPDAVARLKETIDLYFTNKSITFIMGVLADKDFKAEAEMIAGRATNIYTVTSSSPRALDAKILAENLKPFNENVVYCESILEAADNAIRDVETKRSDMIIAFGSLSYLGEIKKYLLEK